MKPSNKLCVGCLMPKASQQTASSASVRRDCMNWSKVSGVHNHLAVHVITDLFWVQAKALREKLYSKAVDSEFLIDHPAVLST